MPAKNALAASRMLSKDVILIFIVHYLDENEFEKLVNDGKLVLEELKELINEDSFNINENILYVNGKKVIDLKKFKENYPKVA